MLFTSSARRLSSFPVTDTARFLSAIAASHLWDFSEISQCKLRPCKKEVGHERSAYLRNREKITSGACFFFSFSSRMCELY